MDTLPSAPWRLWRTLSEHGWTKGDFRILLHGNMPELTLEFVRNNKPAALDAVNADGDIKLEDLFTEEITAKLGFRKDIRRRFLNNVRYSNPEIRTLQELLALSKRELFMRPHISNHTLRYIIAVLTTRGISLFEI